MDSSDQLQKDVNRMKNLSKGTDGYSPGELIQATMFSIAVCFLIGMVVSMPWVGPDKYIPGGLWLGISISGMCFFGGLGMLVRFIESSTAHTYDRELDRRLGGR